MADVQMKGSAVGPLIAYEPMGQPVWAPRDYHAFAREGFMQNAIVYRSVRMVAEAAASIPLLLYEGANEIDEHPLLTLLRRPSADHTGTDFLEAWYGFLLVSGNAYAEVRSRFRWRAACAALPERRGRKPSCRWRAARTVGLAFLRAAAAARPSRSISRRPMSKVSADPKASLRRSWRALRRRGSAICDRSR
jgi:hypothetical protein